MRRRLLRILLAVFLVFSIGGFGAFSSFLFNPFEKRYEYDVASLIPREVDFYFAKAGLARDFDPFPRPRFLDEFLASDEGAALLAIPQVDGFVERLHLDQALAQLDEALAQSPVHIDLLRVFGGEDLALAGFFHGADLAQADWAVYGRVNWMGKLGVELLRYPGVLGLGAQGIEVAEMGDDILRLSGPRIARPIYLTRVRDVVVGGTSQEMLERVAGFESARGQDSFALSAKYGDHIGLLEREGDELELFVDYRRLAEAMGLPGDRPNPYAQELPTAVAGRLFQTGSIRDLIGILGFGEGLSLRLSASISSESVTAFQRRLYRERGFDKARSLEVARLAPQDSGLFFQMNGDVGDLLREAVSAAGEAVATNLDDLARGLGENDHGALIDDLDAAVKDRVALVVRENDYPDEGEAGPPHNDDPVPAWALILWVDDEGKIEELRKEIVARQADLRIKGREPGSPGVFENTVQGGYKVYEYWSELVPGTGHIATVKLADYFIISNRHEMLGQMVKTYFDGAPNYPQLAQENYFKTLVNTGLSSTNLLLWLAPRAISKTMHGLARSAAQLPVAIDWQAERPRIEREVLAQHFAGRRLQSLSQDERGSFDELLQNAVDAFEAEIKAQQFPARRATYERLIQAAEITSGTLLEVGVDPKHFDAFLRVVTPLEPST